MPKTFGEILKRYRKTRNLTQEKLGRLMNIPQPTIGSYEANNREPNFETLQRFAEFFGVPVSYLIPDGHAEDREALTRVMDAMHQDPKLLLLFDKTRYMTPSDIDALLSVVNAIAKERDPDDDEA